ncbi:MAG TPA: hypothetical protein VFE61_05835 [Candidatus Sulfotelmatobacter sp.]|jgi:hypothetical protein|nr:hypothetical protein [Candidatus Sulfotelmatobacter sp.]
MLHPQPPTEEAPALRASARFWEPRRLWYNAILTAIVLLWLVLTWPHFRPALTLDALIAMSVLALGANLCYSAAYLADFAMQAMVPTKSWRPFRWTLFALGTLFAIVLENYWIADEIYPDAPNGGPHLFSGNFTGTNRMTNIASNMNFPAPLAVVGFLAAIGCLFLAAAAVLIFWFARKPKFARIAAIAIGTGAAVYFALLFGFSASSRATTLARGQEKYFCEIDCHLAYSVLDAKPQSDGHYLILLRTRFDETTTSPARPKDAPLTPSPREVHLVDSTGREFAPITTRGTPLTTPLKPADSYITQLEFAIPQNDTGLRLLINTVPSWPDKLVIGDENSLLHKKTYFSL